MVNMIGFHPPTVVYNAAAFGEPGHYFAIRHLPAGGAVVRFPCGRATFQSADDARGFLDLPGDIGHAARHYLEAGNE